jgi:hypothetical protein
MLQRVRHFAPLLGLLLVLAACTPPAPQLGNLLVDIAGLPPGVDANITVNGPDAFSQAVTDTELLGDLTPGDYTVAVGTITTTAVTEYTPVDASVNVAVVANQTATATVSYSTTLGSLQIDVTGLAADANADIVVTGPNGFSASLRHHPDRPRARNVRPQRRDGSLELADRRRHLRRDRDRRQRRGRLGGHGGGDGGLPAAGRNGPALGALGDR